VGLLVTGLSGRALTLGASMAAHAAVAIVAFGGGHATAPSSSVAGPAAEIAIETTPAPAPAEPVANVAGPASEHHEASHAHTHTHPYPVPEDHDLHPHDPSIVHVAGAPAPPSASPDAVTAAADVPLPRFTLAIAPGTVTYGAVAAQGRGVGTGDHDGDHADHGDDVAVPASSVTVAAKRIDAPLGAYPEAARRAGIEGDVAVEIVVDTRGAVVEARPVRHVGYGLDEEAVGTVRRWRFTPAQKDGRAVRVRMTCDVAFRFE
jgi:TonB family protein